MRREESMSHLNSVLVEGKIKSIVNNRAAGVCAIWLEMERDGGECLHLTATTHGKLAEQAGSRLWEGLIVRVVGRLTGVTCSGNIGIEASNFEFTAKGVEA